MTSSFFLGPVVMDMVGYTEKGFKRKLAVQALFGKVYYLSEVSGRAINLIIFCLLIFLFQILLSCTNMYFHILSFVNNDSTRFAGSWKVWRMKTNLANVMVASSWAVWCTNWYICWELRDWCCFWLINLISINLNLTISCDLDLK